MFDKIKILERGRVTQDITINHCEPLDESVTDMVIIYVPPEWLSKLAPKAFGEFDNYEYEFTTTPDNVGAIVIYSYTDHGDINHLVTYLIDYLRTRFEGKDETKYSNKDVPVSVVLKWQLKEYKQLLDAYSDLSKAHELLLREKSDWYKMTKQEKLELRREKEYSDLRAKIKDLQKELATARQDRDIYMGRYFSQKNQNQIK